MLGGRLRPPRGDREVLLIPQPAQLPALIERNRRLLAGLDTPVLGLPLREVRCRARALLVGSADIVVQTGHQPTLYHPGVWIKNFLVNFLARRVGGVPLNLVVDNDSAKHLHLRVPRMLPDGRAQVTSAALVDPAPPPDLTYEECPAPSVDYLAEVSQRISRACPHQGMREGFEGFWRILLEQYLPGCSVAELITAARRRYEVSLGLDNREVMMSQVSATEPFRLLLLHILGEAKRFAEVYNAALEDFRRERRIRNAANPLPNLAVRDGEVELPYWVWRAGEPRRRLFARFSGGAVELHQGERSVLAAPLVCLRDPESGLQLLARAAEEGWKIRPRALTTTIFCRLFLADVFIHGIGGAVYDQVTDRIIRRFFGLEPPGYIVCSATVRLPVPSHGADPGDLRRIRQLLRDLHYNPDRHLEGNLADQEPFRSLIRRKWDLIRRGRAPTAGERRRVFLEIRNLNASIFQRALLDRAEELRRNIRQLEVQLAADRVLTSREYAFCLFPPGVLPNFYSEGLREVLQ